MKLSTVLGEILKQLHMGADFEAKLIAERLHDAGYAIVPMQPKASATLETSESERPWSKIMRATINIEACTLGAAFEHDERAFEDTDFRKNVIPRHLARSALKVLEERLVVQMQAADGTADQMPVYQYGRLIGSMPGLPVKSISPLYEPRPQDFTVVTVNGEPALEAHKSLGPGDFGAIYGFVPEPEFAGSIRHGSDALLSAIVSSKKHG